MKYSKLIHFFTIFIFVFSSTQTSADQSLCQLCTAVENNDVELFSKLSEDKSKLSETNEKGTWPLFIALAKDNKKMAKMLIDAGADVNQMDANGVTALIATVMSDEPHFTRLLIEAGANPNIQSMNMKSNALHIAAFQGRDRVFRELLKAKVDLELENETGMTALLLASTKSKRIVSMLLDAGANPNHVDDATMAPIHQIVLLRDKKLVAKAIEAGADVNLVRHNGTTPLMLAAITKNNASVIELLVEKGANTNTKISLNGITALHLAVTQNRIKNIKKLLKLNADVDALDKQKRSPLFIAVGTRKLAAVKLLIEHGANPDLVDEDGKSPRDLAAGQAKVLALFNER